MQKLRKITRKAGCSECGNMSTHKKTCLYAYVPEPDSRARQTKVTTEQKTALIMRILDL